MTSKSFPNPIATASQDAAETIRRARREAPLPALVEAFRRQASSRATMTPREMRQYAADHYHYWRPGSELLAGHESELAGLAGVQRFAVRRALSRRDKTTPKSEGGPATEPVMIRLNAAQKKKAQRLAKKAGCKTVGAWVKRLVEKEIAQ